MDRWKEHRDVPLLHNNDLPFVTVPIGFETIEMDRNFSRFFLVVIFVLTKGIRHFLRVIEAFVSIEPTKIKREK